VLLDMVALLSLTNHLGICVDVLLVVLEDGTLQETRFVLSLVEQDM